MSNESCNHWAIQIKCRCSYFLTWSTGSKNTWSKFYLKVRSSLPLLSGSVPLDAYFIFSSYSCSVQSFYSALADGFLALATFYRFLNLTRTIVFQFSRKNSKKLIKFFIWQMQSDDQQFFSPDVIWKQIFSSDDFKLV